MLCALFVSSVVDKKNTICILSFAYMMQIAGRHFFPLLFNYMIHSLLAFFLNVTILLLVTLGMSLNLFRYFARPCSHILASMYCLTFDLFRFQGQQI